MLINWFVSFSKIYGPDLIPGFGEIGAKRSSKTQSMPCLKSKHRFLMHQFPLLNVKAEYVDFVVVETKNFPHLVE